MYTAVIMYVYIHVHTCTLYACCLLNELYASDHAKYTLYIRDKTMCMCMYICCYGVLCELLWPLQIFFLIQFVIVNTVTKDALHYMFLLNPSYA